MRDFYQKIEVLILAAGKGTRMCSQTPKVLHKILGKTFMERTLDSISFLGLDSVSVVLGSQKELIQPQLPSKVRTIHQQKQLGTGHAVKQSLEYLSAEYVLILPGDIGLIRESTVKALLERASKTQSPLLVATFEPEEAGAFGRIVRGPDNKVLRITEMLDCSEQELAISEVNAGIYLVKRDFLESAIAKIESRNKKGEFYLTDIVEQASEAEAFVISPPELASGANTIYELFLLENYLKAEIGKELMMSGVRLESLTNLHIEEGVSIGADSYLAGGVKIIGASVLEPGVIVETGVVISGSYIESGAHLKAHSVISDSRVGKNSSVGPFAHLRPGTHLESDVKVGNFVETKKSHLKSGAKAGHLSYLGDSVVGERANIGAGTITCNYDGKDKFETKIGADSFIGSNSSLVAPVEVGSKAFVAAGSVITRDVPKGGLGVARSRQTNKDSWRKK